MDTGQKFTVYKRSGIFVDVCTVDIHLYAPFDFFYLTSFMLVHVIFEMPFGEHLLEYPTCGVAGLEHLV